MESAREKFDEHEEYTSEWIVKIADGDKTADEIADRHGFINKGPASLITVTCTVYDQGIVHFIPRSLLQWNLYKRSPSGQG